MKELSTEEKAKRYDETIERARTEYKNHEAFKGFCEMLVNIFPELEESEDERIRKTLRKRIIRYDPNNEILIKEEGISQKQFLTWLEKQGESDETKAKAFLINKGYPIDANDVFPTYEEMYNIIREGLEQQSEQNHDDKVEPKFKEGQWIISHYNHVAYIKAIDEKNYFLSCDNGSCERLSILSIEYIDRNWRLWTIENAKDGDVIFYDDGWTCIFKHIHGIWYSSYCFITADGEFHTGYEEHAVDSKINGNAHPATKEQRDKLEKAMLKAGYRWNTEERKLEKI